MKWREAATWACVMLAVAGGTAGYHARPDSPERVNDHGVVTAPTAAPSHVQVRKGCRITALGVAPWLTPGRAMNAHWEFDTLAALAEMGVPADIAATLVQRMRQGDPDDLVEFSDYQGAGTSGRRYLPGMSMTFRSAGKPVVCHGSMLVLTNKHRPEPAAVYSVGDYHIAVFTACGNVARVLPAPPGWSPFLLPPDGNPGAPLPAPEPGPGILPPAPAYPPGVAPLPHAGGGNGTVRDVPEPGTGALVLLALGGVLLGRRRGS